MLGCAEVPLSMSGSAMPSAGT